MFAPLWGAAVDLLPGVGSHRQHCPRAWPVLPNCLGACRGLAAPREPGQVTSLAVFVREIGQRAEGYYLRKCRSCFSWAKLLPPPLPASLTPCKSYFLLNPISLLDFFRAPVLALFGVTTPRLGLVITLQGEHPPTKLVPKRGSASNPVWNPLQRLQRVGWLALQAAPQEFLPGLREHPERVRPRPRPPTAPATGSCGHPGRGP